MIPVLNDLNNIAKTKLKIPAQLPDLPNGCPLSYSDDLGR